MIKRPSINHYLLSVFISLLDMNLSFAAVPVENNGTQNTSTQLIASNKPIFLHRIQPVFTFTAGASIAQLGQSESFAPLDLCRYTYKPQGSKTNMFWGGFIGSEVKHSLSWGVIAGLGYYQPNSLATKGTVTQGADPESDNAYSYRYQTQSQQLLAEGKLNWFATERIQPFLMLGIGATFNKMYHYQTSVPPFFEFTPAFSNQIQTNFSYAVGPGIDISVTKLFRVGIGYRFTDLGSANTGRGELDTIPIANTLKQSHVYANQILAQFTYIPWAN